MIDASIFKAYDIRGKVGDQLNGDSVKKIGMAYADWLNNKGTVAVGYDMRPDSKQFAEALTDGLTEQGIDVINIGKVASDMIYFVVGEYGYDGGCMVTASHNPGEYNGIKICKEGAKPVGEDSGLFDVRDIAMAGKFEKIDQEGKIQKKEVMDDWVEHALSFTEPSKLSEYRIAIDAGNGMAGLVMPFITKKLPSFEVQEMFYELDGTFPNHEANPVKTETLKDLQERVLKDKLDFGVAFDGDGDRLGLVDEKGEVLSGSIITAILSAYFLERYPGGTVLYNAVCSNVVPETIDSLGGRPIRTRVGHSFIKADMDENDAVFAGEDSCHYFFKDNFNADSGLIALIVMIDALNNSGGSLSELAAQYRKYESLEETNFEVEEKHSVMQQVEDAFKDSAQSTDWLDGVTVRFKDGSWFNLRPSNTEPLLRMNAEANSEAKLAALVESVKTAAGL